MEINVTLIGQMIAFALFVWFTMKYVWPPITGAMQERQQKIADGLAAGEKGARELQDASVKSEEALQVAREEAREVIAGANRQANQILEEARTLAQSEGVRIKSQAQAEIDQGVSSARDSLRKQLAGLAVSGAAQILQREIDAKAHSDIIERLAAQI
jgi:F-type H+-transporting ATPase subunit b